MTQAIKDRIQGRQDAIDLIEVIRDELPGDERSDPYIASFFGAIIAFSQNVLAMTPDDRSEHTAPSRPAMSDEEAKRFERNLLGFGKFANHSYANCPTWYLLKMHQSGEELGAHLRSKRGQKRQSEE